MSNRILLSALFLCAANANALPLANGDFSAGLAGWNDANSTGTVAAVGGTARLSTGTGTDPYSAVLVQGDDGGFTFGSPITLGPNASRLVFDASFSFLTAADETIGGFWDSLGVAVYDALDNGRDLVFANLGIDHALVGTGHFSIDIAVEAGRAVALSFELADANDGRDAVVTLDNVAFLDAATAAPEPHGLALFGLGLALLRRYRPLGQ